MIEEPLYLKLLIDWWDCLNEGNGLEDLIARHWPGWYEKNERDREEMALNIKRLVDSYLKARVPAIEDKLVTPYCGGCGHRFYGMAEIPASVAKEEAKRRTCGYCLEEMK